MYLCAYSVIYLLHNPGTVYIVYDHIHVSKNVLCLPYSLFLLNGAALMPIKRPAYIAGFIVHTNIPEM